MGKKKAAVVYINNETGVVAAEVYKKAFTAAGGQVVAYEAYDPKATDFTGALLKVRSANPDMIHLQGLVSDTPQVIAQMRQLGLAQPISSYSGGVQSEARSAARRGGRGSDRDVACARRR